MVIPLASLQPCMCTWSIWQVPRPVQIAGRAKKVKVSMEDGTCGILPLPVRPFLFHQQLQPAASEKQCNPTSAMKKQRQQRGGEPGAGTFKYQDVTLSKGEAAELAEGQPISQCAPRLQRAIVLTCESTVKHLKNRFSSLLEENTKDAPTAKAVKCFNVFSHDFWADNRLELLNHGVEEVNFLLRHFSTVLDRNGCSKEKAKEEFQLMKMTINTSFKDKSYLGLWQVMTTKEPYCSDFANILHLVKIMLVLPISSAVCEKRLLVSKQNQVRC
ncbi:uncharacterized protein LOC130386899 isoform X1 [Gadus chalcogrammus]|uniref:uncharacterized protein LOC130386899 isoform X1 n=1 Tax=Gadus chalcogrammus TaxID=1042646 RepID=UPI0024C49BF5|nr:uncharacterized protein LOC130386899 isoform X1 [Gadus chalcogrammus]